MNFSSTLLIRQRLVAIRDVLTRREWLNLGKNREFVTHLPCSHHPTSSSSFVGQAPCQMRGPCQLVNLHTCQPRYEFSSTEF